MCTEGDRLTKKIYIISALLFRSIAIFYVLYDIYLLLLSFLIFGHIHFVMSLWFLQKFILNEYFANIFIKWLGMSCKYVQ